MYQGLLSMNTGSGNVMVDGAVIKGASNFSSGSGNVEVSLDAALDYDVSLGTGSGNAT